MSRFYTYSVCLIVFLVNVSEARTMTYEEMKIAYGNNKTLLPEIEVPTIIALTFYPELRNVSVRFEYKKIGTTMCTRPDVQSIFRKERAYVIYINPDVSETGGVSLKELNLIQSIGLIAHELAHIVDFEKRNNFAVIKCGILYSFSPNYHIKLERATDEMVINKGLGKELYEFTNYVVNTSQASEKYKAFKKKNYLLPEEIKQRMK